MGRNFKSKCTCPVTWIVCLTVACIANAQSLTEGTGRAEFQHICSACHGLDTVTSQHMSRAEWAGVVNDMVSRGAQGTQGDLDNVLTYLSTSFGKGITRAPPPTRTPPPVPQSVIHLSEAEVAKAKAILKGNACLSCHRIGDTGSYLGQDLTDSGLRRSPEQLRAALLSPGSDVHPENRSVRLVTGGGEIVTGKLLNQGGFSVQLIDSAHTLRSFQKAAFADSRLRLQIPCLHTRTN
jgi:putative heme-binding domain-containing protein